ncbi:MAG TPA: hypothetical protein VKZ63_18625, partial [Kofleriaceae bacterium]|nr:hypothetical protein [Kofleriaceae bacterium]
MKVSLRDIPCRKRVELGAEFVGAAVAGLPMRAALERPEGDPEAGSAVAELDFHADGEHVFARGRLEGWIDVACSRCIGPVRLVVSEALTVTYLPASRVPSEEEQG